MENVGNNKDNSNKNKYSYLKKFLEMVGIPNDIKLILNEIKPYFSIYCKKIYELYKYICIKKIKRNINFIIKYFLNKDIGKNRFFFLSNNKNSLDIRFILLIIFCFKIFNEVIICKNKEKNLHKKYFLLIKLNDLLSSILIIIGKFYYDRIIDEDKFEMLLKFLIILSISQKINEVPNKNERIANMMFFKECIYIIKIVFNKIFETKNEFSEKQENLINNIILYIQENVIGYLNKKPINIINKSYLSNNDYFTSSIIDLAFIISKMKKKEIIKNFIDLLSNIYAFSFRYENLMTPILKILEPLLINLNIKKIENIDSELNLSNIPIKLLNGLIEKEEKILTEDPIFLKNGFYLGNKLCGLSSEIDNLESDCLLIFGFSLHEINKQVNDIKEWTIINIRNNNNKDNESQMKISLSRIENSNQQYHLLITVKNKIYPTGIIITSKKSYIFSFNFTKTWRTKKLKIIYSEYSNNSSIKEINEINIPIFNEQKIKLYIGCDINSDNKNSLNLSEEKNTFTGFIGTIIILNPKKIKKFQEIDKLILSLKGDYDSIILIPLENIKKNSSLINSEVKYNYNNEFKYKKVNEKIITLIEDSSDLNFIEAVNVLISPKSFRLVEYKDDIDYLNLINNYELYEYSKKKPLLVRQNYLNIKRNSGPSNSEKMIKIFTPFFNNRFHIFENKYTIVEFVKFDGIYYLCLLLEYYYQILSNIENQINNQNITNKSNKNNNINIINDKKNIFIKIENNICEIIRFFIEKILNKQYCKNFIREINHFFYQMTVTIKKYAVINILGDDIFHLIKNIIILFINFIREENSDTYLKEFENIRNKLLNLLYNLSLCIYPENVDEMYKKIENFLDIISELLKIGYLNDIFSNKFFDKLLSFSFLFDNSNSLFKSITNKEFLNNLQSKYFQLLKEFLTISYSDFLFKNNKEDKKQSLRKSGILKIFDKNKNKDKVNEEKYKEEKNEGDFEFLNYYLESSLQNVNFPYIFSNLLNILYNSELIGIIPFSYIQQIQEILLENYKDMDINKNSQLICESSFKILSTYYFTNKEKEYLLHDYLKNIPFYKGFFNSLFSSLKQIQYITSDDKFAKKESERDLRINSITSAFSLQSDFKINSSNNESNNSLNRINCENEILKNLEIGNKTEEKKEMSNYDLYPLLKLNLNSLSKKQNGILIKLLEDCISMLFKEKENKTEIHKNITNNDAKEIYTFLKKNLDAALEVNGKNVYKDIFSSNKDITAELFYFKWKFCNDEEQLSLLNELKDYHKKLLTNHSFPFIFKFILLIYSEENKEKENRDIVSNLLCFIFNELEIFFKSYSPSKRKDDNYYFICNSINLIIVINKLFNIKENSNLFKNKSFYEMFFKLIKLLEKIGLLYSNYCFEIKEDCGKTIGEICFDLLIYFLNTSDIKEEEQKFIEIFIKENRQLKEYYSIFYLIDLLKEDILEKERGKITKKNLEKYIEGYKSLIYIHKSIFNSKDTKNQISIFGKRINQIENVNFSIYILSKTFLYLNSGITMELTNFLKEVFLPLLADNIFKLWTKKNEFYGHRICGKFLLYSYTKQFIETQVIQKPNDFKIYTDFFEKVIPYKLKDKNNVNYCYASKLLDKKETDNNNIKVEENSNKNLRNSVLLNLKKTNKIFNINFLNPADNNILFDFEELDKRNIIYNPKNYLMKIIFSSTFKDIFFNDKVFKEIRSSYLCFFQDNKTLNVKTKQLNYPTKQKNFSNFIEPKTFLRRDYNFYTKDFFEISHKYLKKNIIKESDKTNLFFYPHNYYSNNIFKTKDFSFDCELITTQFLYFGKIYFGNDFICFESMEDPRDINKEFELDIFMKYVFSQRDNDNRTTKKKRIIIFNEDIKEIIRRRTLEMYQSIEIFNLNGKSYFFNFFKTNLCDKVFEIFQNINNKYHFTLLSKENIKQNIKDILSKFKIGKISNYEYLLELNKLSSRTFNDLTQYPVFPWLILKIDKLFELTNIDDPLVNIFDDNIRDYNNKDNEIYIRDMNYPISMQNYEKREEEINKYSEEKSVSKYPFHLGTHYSTSSYIFYYLMRLNPFGQNLIKLQNYKQENPNRMFLSFRETQLILKSSSDNRELIPELFCFIDFLCNLNCSFYGIRANSNLVDDFYVNEENQELGNNINLISTFVEFLYRQRKLLNHIYTSKKLHKWVDIIFGKKQLPKDQEEAKKSCNIFNKFAYEQYNKLEKKLNKYNILFKNSKMDEKKLKIKMQNKINFINNFGICPSQILSESNIYEGEQNINIPNKINIKIDGNYLYFTKIKNNQYLSIKESYNTNSSPVRSVIIYDNKLEKEKNIFSCNIFEDDISKIYINMENSGFIHLYKPNYTISQIIISDESNQDQEIFILTCRFLGNYFKVQNLNNTIMVLCEDFVTCIVSRDSKENDMIFYTGLKNGKLTKWKIEIIKKFQINNKKKFESSIFEIKEISHIYDHKSSITALEINNIKNIIATAGEDKFIHIRKLYDFEILTSIDLTYSFGNSIISKNKNIFPSLIKISDINCIYVLLYDYKYKKTKIRGYTLNGLFFAETDENITGVGNNDFSFNNISFNKNWNLIVGVYNYDEILLLNSYNLKVKFQKRLENRKNNHYGNNWIEYNSSTKEFIILYDNECHIKSLIEEEKNIFDS